MISIIVCTYNRVELLEKTLESLLAMKEPAADYEILVVDNNSTDGTRDAVYSKISQERASLSYIRERNAGLHNVRHRGAIEARGDIICYQDDDQMVDKLWLEAVVETFNTTDADLVGGKILPVYEVEPPQWIKQFVGVTDQGVRMGQLGLIDLGNEIKRIDPSYVWGGNYSIRKDVLFECGGFHPDSMPSNLIKYRGDGETALSAAIKEKGYKAYYNPKACVYHYIPKERLTVEYFCKRMFCQGISDSFTQIRKDGNIQNPITLKIRDAYNKGMAYHHEQVLSDPELLKWILKKEYFKSENSSIEAQLRQFENCPTEERQSFYDKNRNYYEFKERLIELGVPVKDIEIDINDFEMWRKMNPAMENSYKRLGDAFIEKLLEHYLTYTLLEIKVGDVFIDVAASGSPWADILSERGIESYRLDLSYERGINGRDIGADASDTKLPDNFASVLTLHCAYECFMGDADRLFIKEAERILKNNGRFAIVPLYFDPIYLILTSPYCDQGEVIIDPGAKKVWRDDKYKAPFSRHYSPEVFVKRIYSKLNTMKGQLYFINNIAEIQQAYPDQKVYCYFVFVGRKNGVSNRSDTEKEASEELCAFRQNNLGYKNVPVPSRMGADHSDSRHIERVATIVNLADHLCQEERIEEALGKYDEAIRLHPNFGAIQYKRASCLLRLGRIAEAKAAIKYEAEHGKDPFTAKKMLEKMWKAEFNYRVKSFFAGVDDDFRWVDRFELSLEIAVIYITERCNSRCITCTSWQNRQDCGLDTKIWISILKDIRQLGISSVAFTGGEPLLRRDLPQLVTTSKDLGFSTILICTNGLDLKQQRLNELERCGANSFHVSLDGLKENYKFIRGVDGYHKAMRAIEMIADRKIPLAVLSTLMRQNIDDLERIAEIAAGHGASWFINLLENKKYLFKGVNIAPMLIADQTEIGRAIEILRSIKSRYADTCAYNEADIDYIRDYLEDPDREANIPCTVGWHSIYFDPAGNLYSGCMSLPPVGNAVDVPVSEVVSSPAMKKHLKAMIQRKCKGCTCGYRQRAALCAGNGEVWYCGK